MALPCTKVCVKMADFCKFDTSKGRDISLPRFIDGCAIYAKNLASLKSKCVMLVFNVAPTGDHAKPLKCLRAGGAIAPFLDFGWVCSSCHGNVAPISAVFWGIS